MSRAPARSIRRAIALHALHWGARAAVATQTPLRARTSVAALARWVPRCQSVEEARAALAVLGRSGTCLSRSLTIAALLPGSHVVIGFHRDGAAARSAHAWIEMHGAKIEDEQGAGSELFQEMARLTACDPE